MGTCLGAFKQIQMPGFTPRGSDEVELEQSLGRYSKNLVSAMCHRGWEALSWWLNLCDRVNQKASASQEFFEWRENKTHHKSYLGGLS